MPFWWGVTINKRMLLKELMETQTIVGADEEQVPLYNKAVDMLRELLNIPSDIKLSISLKPGISLDKGQNGLTIPNPNNPKHIFIFLNPNLVGAEVITTLAHEMVHVKQIVEGRMDIQLVDGSYNVEWEGKEVPNAKYSRGHPWEIEAHTQERPLTHQLIQKLQSTD